MVFAVNSSANLLGTGLKHYYTERKALSGW